MSSATKDLENDHVNILRLTDVIEKITKAGEPLFKMADNVLTVENHAGLLNEYSTVIPLTEKGGGLTDYLNDIERLDKKYH